MKVYLSYEIRWFSSAALREVEMLFRNHGSIIKPDTGRTDRYLINNRKTFSLKVREGRLEFKGRDKSGEKIEGIGTPSYWTKWSYELEGSQVLNSFSADDYLDVKKDRTLLFTQRNDPGFYLEGPGNRACQLEYGMISVKDKTFYTLGFEAFGPDTSTLHHEMRHALELMKPVLSDIVETEPIDYPDLLAGLS
ncbi:MAG: hypothetical protein P8X57_12645 [Cyclobacteriaceae bacterium]